MESEQVTPMDLKKDVDWSSVWALEFDQKHLKKAGGYIGRSEVNIIVKMKTIFRKLWRIKRS